MTENELPSHERGRQETVLVTGAGGFVGRALVEHLAGLGYRVIGASRQVSPSVLPGCAEMRPLPSPDHGHQGTFDALLHGVDHLVHLAAIAHTRLRGEQSRKAYHSANFLLTKRLAEAAARHLPGKFVFISSSRAQCGASYQGVLTETSEPRPVDDYGRAKLAGEVAVKNALKGGRFSILRPVLVYGAGVRGNFGTLVKLASLPLPLPFGALTARRSLVDRDALCRAISHCLYTSATDEGTFLVADRQAIAVNDIIGAIRQGLGKQRSLVIIPPALLAFGAVLTGQNAKWETLNKDLIASSDCLRETGWQPTEDTAAAIRRHVATESRMGR